jgi:hypothetical protein
MLQTFELRADCRQRLQDVGVEARGSSRERKTPAHDFGCSIHRRSVKGKGQPDGWP